MSRPGRVRGHHVVAPDGRAWRVAQHRFRRPRWRGWRRGSDEEGGGNGSSWGSFDLGGGDDACGAILLVIAVVVAAILIGILLLPVLIFLGELVVLAVLAYVLGRWWVVADTEGPPPEQRIWRVRGGVRAQRFAQEVAVSIQTRGVLPGRPSERDRA